MFDIFLQSRFRLEALDGAINGLESGLTAKIVGQFLQNFIERLFHFFVAKTVYPEQGIS